MSEVKRGANMLRLIAAKAAEMPKLDSQYKVIGDEHSRSKLGELSPEERRKVAQVQYSLLFDVALKTIEEYEYNIPAAQALWDDAFDAAASIDAALDQPGVDHVALAATRAERVRIAGLAWFDRASFDDERSNEDYDEA
jgi:hypothetical protein